MTDGERDAHSSLRRAAKIAGAAYLITDASSIFAIYTRSALVVTGNAAQTAANIVAHAQLFRAGIVSDVLTGAGVIVLNLAFYKLLASVHRTLAQLALMWRMIEVAVGTVIAISSFVALSLLTGTQNAATLPQSELPALAQLFIGAQQTGYLIVLLFVGLGSTTYMYLLIKSRYVPKPLALLGFVGSALVFLFALARLLFPAFVTSASAAVRTLPPAALVVLAIIAVPILAFEIVIGSWLVVKGIRIPEAT